MALSLQEIKPLFKNSCLPLMDSALQQVFRAADVAIIQLATDASLNAEQNSYFDAVQGLRIVKKQLIASFGQRLLHILDDEAEPELLADVEHVNSLRKLLSINIESWRADTALAAATFDLQQRLAAIDPALKNPLFPEHVVESFLQCLGEARLDINTKMLMLRMFEGQIYARLERYVRLANDALAQNGILPELDTQPSEAVASLNAIVEETMGQEVDGKIQKETLLLGNALADLQANDFESMEKRLDPAFIMKIEDKPQVRNLMADLQAQKYLPAKVTNTMKLQLDKITLVGKLFQFIVDDNNLPLEARYLLVLLQLPYARVALADSALLQNDKHPAKALLNEMIQVSAGWQPSRNNLPNDPLFNQLRATVQLFIESERLENIKFKELLFQYLAFGEAQRQKSVKATQRLLDSQLGAEVADTVRDAVNKILEKKIGTKKISGAVRRILAEGWNNVLFMVALQKGLAAPEWQAAVDVVDDLLDSVKPASEFSSRSEFILKLPPLLSALHKGLASIEMSTTLINQLLTDLEDEHKKRVRSIKGDFNDLEKIAVLRPSFDEPVITEEEVSPHQKYIVRTSIVFSPEKMLELAEEAVEVVRANAKDIFSQKTQDVMGKLGPGVSLLWNKPQGQLRCRIAAHIKHARKFIVSDRSGAKLAELTEFEMAQKIDNSEIEIMASEQLFDRALESVIGNIRDRR